MNWKSSIGGVSVILALIVIAGSPLSAQTFDHSYKSYGNLLSAYVSNGLVDYESIKRDSVKLSEATREFAEVTPDKFGTFSGNQQLVFWINAYNLFTIKAIVDHYPVESIKDIDGVWDKIRFSVAGKALTLDNIEHDILRKKFAEPRIHVAIVCASISCPELWDRPFLPDSIGRQLETRSHAFVQDTTRNKWSNSERRLYLSKILDWYGDDFKESFLPAGPFPDMDGKDGATAHFYYDHADESIRDQMTSKSFQVKHLKYDWSLNEQR